MFVSISNAGQPPARLAVLVLSLLASACGDESEPPSPPRAGSSPAAADLPPTARPELPANFREARAQPRHPSDGGGRAWMAAAPNAVGDNQPDSAAEAEPPAVRAGTPSRWRLVYEAGPLGVATGGYVLLQVSPFWNWSPPQSSSPGARGYSTVETDADGVELEVFDSVQGLVAMIHGRALAAGEQLRFVYGAGPNRAVADRYAERLSRFWFRVDGDGDGNSAVLVDSPGVTIEAGPPAQLLVTVPSTAVPGEDVRVTLALLDVLGNAGFPFDGTVQFVDAPEELELPDEVRFEAADRGRKTIIARVTSTGLFRLQARARETDGEAAPIEAVSNPLLVGAQRSPVLWGDLHGHSNLSDGTGTVEDYFLYARDVSALDVVALTDHDHWGVLYLDEYPELWEHIQEETKRFHEPGRFVTLLGYEWTSWIHGHRHVLYFDDHGEVHSSIDPETETPRQLWDALEGLRALTFAHHSAGGPIATDWSFAPDPVLEPLTEVVSVHGVSEAPDAPPGSIIYNPLRGNFVRDVLDRGYQLGFLGSGDSHDGHPGLAHLAGSSGGLAAILAEEPTREAVLTALRARRVYATNGPRILLRTALDGHRMGAKVPAPAPGETAQLLFSIVGTGPLEAIEIVQRGEPVTRYTDIGAWEATSTVELAGLESGDYVYVRVTQLDGGLAWSSPFFVE